MVLLRKSLCHGWSVEQQQFPGSFPNRVAIGHLPVIPEKIKPMPINADKPNKYGWTNKPSATPVSTTAPATLRACNSSLSRSWRLFPQIAGIVGLAALAVLSLRLNQGEAFVELVSMGIVPFAEIYLSSVRRDNAALQGN
jgi:hypothetical protein